MSRGGGRGPGPTTAAAGGGRRVVSLVSGSARGNRRRQHTGQSAHQRWEVPRWRDPNTGPRFTRITGGTDRPTVSLQEKATALKTLSETQTIMQTRAGSPNAGPSGHVPLKCSSSHLKVEDAGNGTAIWTFHISIIIGEGGICAKSAFEM